jgi:CheY-like chemotaxis protein
MQHHLKKKVTECYYPEPDLSMIFVISFFRTHQLPRRNYFVAEFQEICKISCHIHGQVMAALTDGRKGSPPPTDQRLVVKRQKQQRTFMTRVAVLLVDDEEDFRFIFTRQIKRILPDLEWEFFEAADGEEALQLIRTGLKPSIIILDYTMPRMSGTELLRRIDREHSDLLNVPRVVLSGYIGEDAIREVQSLRCDYIEKSMNTKIFYQQFCRYLTAKLGCSFEQTTP